MNGSYSMTKLAGSLLKIGKAIVSIYLTSILMVSLNSHIGGILPSMQN